MKYEISQLFVVDLKGFEPSTSRMRTERSPSWATSPNMKLFVLLTNLRGGFWPPCQNFRQLRWRKFWPQDFLRDKVAICQACSPSWATSPYSLAYPVIIHISRKKARGISAPAASLANQNADINFMYFTYVYFVIYYFLLRVCAAFDDFNTTP